MSRHTLKTDTEVFQASWDEEKSFELRFDDRNYKVGDYLLLVETAYSGEQMKNGKPLIYTGRAIEFNVIYKLNSQYGLKDGWCILDVALEWAEEYVPESLEFQQLVPKKEQIEMKKIKESSNVEACGWLNNTLAVEFKGGAIYHYLYVPHQIFEELLAADSFGKYLNGEIKPRFRCEKQ